MLDQFSFSGRHTRTQYWNVHNWLIVYLSGIIFPLIYMTADATLQRNGDISYYSVGWPDSIWITVTILMVPFFWLSLASSIKRYHDLGKSGLWFILGFVPGGAIWVVIELGFFAGTPGSNEYGGKISFADVFMDEKEYASRTSGPNARVSGRQNDRKPALNQPGRDVGGAPLFGKRGRQATN